MKKLSLSFVALTIAALAFSQDTTRVQMFGKIFDRNNKPIGNVSVELKGTKFNTVTNGEGNYFFMIPAKKGTLVFKRAGFVTKEMAFTGTPQATDLILLEEKKALKPAN